MWDDEEEKWCFPIVDVVAVLTDSPNSNNYWKVLKHRLLKEGNQSVTNCNQPKLQSADGKYYKHSGRRQNCSGTNHGTCLLETCVHAACGQDNAESHHTDDLHEIVVVEMDSEAVFAEKHAHGKKNKNQQCRHTRLISDFAC